MEPNQTMVEALPDTSRVWIYQSGRSLSAEEIDSVLKSGRGFVAQWASHGSRLAAGFEVLFDRFVILMVDEDAAGASGCSIDSSVHFMQDLEIELSTTFFDRMTLCYLDNGKVEDCQMSEISELINSGVLTKDTIVFDNTIQTKLQLGDHWKVRLEDSWVGRYL